VLLNLCVNARDAMPEGGKLVVRSENLVLTEEDAILHPDQGPGKYVLLRVSDTGTGIAESIREKIFDPFFTTKEPGKGTGLGLSTVQAIIKNHNGTINVVSEVGRGTTFNILLPATETNRVDAAVGVENQLLRGRGELILVVDDEAGVLMITQRTLENYGYRVVTAKNGADGLTVFLPNRHDIAAVITDVMMPVMDGPTMIREIRRFCPDFPIIATSGLSGQEYLAKAHDAGVQAFLAKPYTAEAILRSIANLLAARRAEA
jgi:CheY-like chemotaxis protein